MSETNFFTEYTSAIAGLNPSSLINGYFPESLLINRERELSTWYSPFDYVNVNAKIVIVGITPGYQQAANALLKAHEILLAGGSEQQAKAEAKVYASFSGAMRNNLTEMLDHVGIHRILNIAGTKSLFGDKAHLAHFTSVLRYPVMIKGSNYNGTPSMISTPFLRAQLEQWFGSECQILPDALYIPLGPKVAEALHWLAQKGILNSDRILDGIPHPSGANAERINYFLMKKSKEALSSRTNGDAIDKARTSVLNKIRMLPT